MCEQGPNIKFCSCAEGELSVPFWKLFRPSSDYKKPMIMGIFLPPSEIESSYAEEISSRIAFTEALETGDAFDFDYCPEEGDIFELHTIDGVMVFRAEECLVVMKGSKVPQKHIGWCYEDSMSVEGNNFLTEIACGTAERVSPNRN